MTVYFVISLPKIPYINRIYTVLANLACLSHAINLDTNQKSKRLTRTVGSLATFNSMCASLSFKLFLPHLQLHVCLPCFQTVFATPSQCLCHTFTLCSPHLHTVFATPSRCVCHTLTLCLPHLHTVFPTLHNVSATLHSVFATLHTAFATPSHCVRHTFTLCSPHPHAVFATP